MTISVDAGGSFLVDMPGPAWRFQGNTGAAPFHTATGEGEDGAGPYRELTFDYSIAGAARSASIRCYLHRNAVLFTSRWDEAAPNAAPFPIFSGYPSHLHRLSFHGMFAAPVFGGTDRDSPWIYFDSGAAAFIVSPASDFMVSNTSLGREGEIVMGLAPQIASLPAGFTHQTLLVAANSVNAAFDTWGSTLTALKGKQRPSNDADLTLRSLGYWTDNGAPYYYRTAPSRTDDETLTAVRDEFAARGLPLGYMQLDSWFYPKGPQADWRDLSGGIHEYIGAPALFQPTLGEFQRRLGLPLVAHARWIDAASPYRRRYRLSADVVVDRAFWDEVARYLAESGVRVFEQDWLGDKARTDLNLSDPKAFMSNMAAAMEAHGITLQYCMASPRHFLASTKYGNVTTIRASQDRFDRSHWTNFLYSSRLAGALGLWPFTDGFQSTEPDNLLVATLSAGPVGVIDPLGAVDAESLARAVRADGIIVKPDVPLVPMDSVYPAEVTNPYAPMVASTHSNAGGLRAYYVLAYTRGGGDTAQFSPAGLGVAGPAYVYNYFTGTGSLVNPGNSVNEPMPDGRAYYIVAPVNARGIALLGDSGHFVTMGAKRISRADDFEGEVRATVVFAAGENARTLFGYSLRRPRFTMENGSIGESDYDAATGRFSVSVSPAPDGTASIRIDSAVRDRCWGAVRSRFACAER